MASALNTVERAIAGETLDHLCWRTLGSVDVIEDVIALRARLREEHGWVMDVYTLSTSSSSAR